MAYQISDGAGTPHATNYSDLLDKLVTFATANGWTLHNDQRGTLGELTLKGTGLAGTDAIYIGIKRYANAGADAYGWIFQGYTAFTNAGFHINPGAIVGAVPALTLWNDPIPYWFVVNARRIIVVAKISTVYVAAYLGYILPYGTPGQWPYPLVIGGTNISSDGVSVPRYSVVTTEMSVPFIPGNDASNNSPLVVRMADGAWVRLFNQGASITPPAAGGSTLKTMRGVWPYCEKFAENNSPQTGWARARPNLAGDYPLLPLRLMRSTTPDALGIMDGVKFVPGFGMSSEDTVTEGADTYVVFQDTFRTNLDSFFAVKVA